MDSPALEVYAETNNDAHTGYECMQNKEEDRRFRGNQSLAHGDKLFERYVCVSVRVAHFFTRTGEAPSLMDRVQCTDLASNCGNDFSIVWDIVYAFATGYDGKGACNKIPHTL